METVRVELGERSYDAVIGAGALDEGDGAPERRTVPGSDALGELGVGCIPFSPLAQGLLTGKYLKGVPDDSRAARNGSLQASGVTPELVAKLQALDAIAKRRGQSLAQLALTWILRDARVTSALIGARTVEQLDDSLDALKAGPLSGEEIGEIEAVLA